MKNETAENSWIDGIGEISQSQDITRSEEVCQAPDSESIRQSAPEEVPASESGVAEQSESSAILEYVKGIFSQKHINEFLDSLSDEQGRFIYSFISGFRTHATVTGSSLNIVGVYDPKYLKMREVTPELLNSLGIKMVTAEVKDFDFSFVLIWE